jgi:trimeric autotransporter adhesin
MPRANILAVDGGCRVYKVTKTGTISVIAGAGVGYLGDGGPATQARFNGLTGIALDSAGNIYVADSLNFVVRKIGTDGNVQTVAGTGQLQQNSRDGDGGQAIHARLFLPSFVAVDSTGVLYIGQAFGIRKVTAAGIISTLAGEGSSLTDGALAINAPIGYPYGLAVDKSDNLYVADPSTATIRVITGTTIRTVSGTSLTSGFSGDGGAATAAQLNYPRSLAFDSAGNYYIADQFNLRIRKVSGGTITTVAGRSHFSGDGGPATGALMHLPDDVVVDSAGNLVISDNDNHRIRRVTPSGIVSTIAGTGKCAYTGDGGRAADAALCYPSQMAFDSSGNLYFADSGNSAVRKITTAGQIATVAGTGTYGDGGDGGQAAGTQLKYPRGLAIDAQNNLYISDYDAERVKKVTAATGGISTIAGNGNNGFSGDGGFASGTKLSGPGHLSLDTSGNLYIIDEGNLRVRKLSPNGIIQTIAGITDCCATTGKGTQTYLDVPGGVAVDRAGNVFIARSGSNLIDRLTPAGDLTTVAGGDSTGLGDGSLATNASLFFPRGLWLDASGDLYVADTYNSRIRKLTLNSANKLAITGGDNQAGAVSAPLPLAISVQASFRAGVAVAGIPVTFAVMSGSATLSAAATSTDASGRAGVAVTLGAVAGPVVVSGAIPGLPAVQFHLTANAAAPPPSSNAPTISAGGITGAGGSIPAVTQLSPGGLATIFGSNFAPAGTFVQLQASDLVNGNLPTALAGVCVEVGGHWSS